MSDQKQNLYKHSALHYLRTIYLSLAALIGLICFVIGAVSTTKLALNHWLLVDELNYYTPYGQSACEMSFPDAKGNQEKLTAEQVKDCQKKTAENELKQNQNNFNRQLNEGLSLILVGLPIWLLHFYLIQTDWKRRKEF